jgi:hypothetical protein
MSLTDALKRRGPNTDYCGTPEETAKGDEKAPTICAKQYRSIR